MALNWVKNKKSNMYQFIDATWNTVKGACPHDCSYCYMKKWGKQPELHFDEKELKTDLGSGNFIFVGSSCDMFADAIPDEWIAKTLDHCSKFKNSYLFQTKNPDGIYGWRLPEKPVICTTIETDRWYPEIMNNCPPPNLRGTAMWGFDLPKYVTIEPIMDFNISRLLLLLQYINPQQVNIGADSGNNNLPEPSPEKVRELIKELEKFTKVHIKKNLNRILNQ